MVPSLTESVKDLQNGSCCDITFMFNLWHNHFTDFSTTTDSKCETGMSSPFPSGYFYRNNWNPGHCTLPPLPSIDTCLAGKVIYFMGDSTLRQWIEYFPRLLTSKFLNKQWGVLLHFAISSLLSHFWWRSLGKTSGGAPSAWTVLHNEWLCFDGYTL